MTTQTEDLGRNSLPMWSRKLRGSAHHSQSVGIAEKQFPSLCESDTAFCTSFTKPPGSLSSFLFQNYEELLDYLMFPLVLMQGTNVTSVSAGLHDQDPAHPQPAQ